MNYLAHGFRHSASPWRCAGTALPDWVRILRARCRAHEARAAEVAATTADPRLAELAAGVVRHHADDRAFHQSSAFTDTLHEATEILAPLRAAVPGFRARFAAHVLIEMLLDAALADEDPSRLDSYYSALAGIAPDDLAEVAAPLLEGTAGLDRDGGFDGLAPLVRSFTGSRFVAEYRDDRRVVARYAQVAARAGVPPGGAALEPHIAPMRRLVTSRAAALVAPTLG